LEIIIFLRLLAEKIELLEINLKIRERFSSVNEIENLNNFVKN
jgi:hypothetical protein